MPVPVFDLKFTSLKPIQFHPLASSYHSHRVILFKIRGSNWPQLSNLYQHPVTFGGQTLPSLEHHFQSVFPRARKDPLAIAAIESCETGSDVKVMSGHYKLGDSRAPTIAPTWSLATPTTGEIGKYAIYKQHIMLALVAAKFVGTQLQNILITTGDCQMWEAVGDRFYGVGMDYEEIIRGGTQLQAKLNRNREIFNVTGQALATVRDFVNGRTTRLGSDALIVTDSQGVRFLNRPIIPMASSVYRILPYSGGGYSHIFQLATYCTTPTTRQLVVLVGTNELANIRPKIRKGERKDPLHFEDGNGETS
jgi:predicted NAD-dependent protein-ADP-ribosyltransferase YbiA (DUF1768 family)